MRLGQWMMITALLLATGMAHGQGEALKTFDETVATLPHSDAAGQVVDRGGKPVAGAEVFLYYQRGEDGFRDRLAGKTQTDTEGRFTFKGAVAWEPLVEANISSEPPKYDVLARDTRLGIAFTVFREGDPQDKLKITMNKPEYINVTVKDDKGTSLAGTRVFIADGELPKAKASGLARAYTRFRISMDIGLSSGVTGADGRLKMLALPEATYWAVKEGYAKGWYRDMTLFPDAEISGRVTDPDGKPVPGAPVWFNYSGQSLVYSDVAVTDKDGRYALKNLPGKGFRFSWMAKNSEDGAEGKVSLSADDMRASSTLVGKPLNFTINPGDKLTKNLTMTPSALLTGRVVDEVTGKPMAGMRLYRSQGDGSNSLKEFKTDRDGRFMLRYPTSSEASIYMESSSDGSYILEEEQSGHQVYKTTLSKPRTEVELKAKLWQVGTLQGVVLGADGKPQNKVTVYLHSDVPAVTTGQDGGFTLKCAPKDRDFDLYAVDSSKKNAALAHLKAGTTSATIRLVPTRDYTGKVTTPDGMPANNLKFYFDLKINKSTIFDARLEPKTGNDGTFKAAGLCPQTNYYAWWNSDNETNREYDWGNATIVLSKLKAGEPITFQAMQFINTLMGKVQDEQGKPVAGAQIKVTTDNMVPQELRFNKTYTSDAQGAFTIERLGAGKVSLKISHPSYKSATIQTPSDSIDAAITLKPKGNEAVYKVQVVDAERKPMAGVPVTLLTIKHEKETMEMTTQTQMLRTDKGGNVKFRRTFGKDEEERATSSGTICCDLPGYDLAFGALQGDEDADIELVLRKSGECWSGQVVDDEKKPIAGAKVTVSIVRCEKDAETASPMESPQTTFTTDKEGRFTLSRFGKQCGLSLTVTAKGYSRTNEWVDENTNPKALFTLQSAGTVKGKVRFKTGGQFNAKGLVFMVSRQEGGTPGEVGPDGSFTVDGLKSGEYAAQFLAKNKADQKYLVLTPITVNVTAGTVTNLNLELEEGIPVQGKLTNPKTGKLPEGKYYISLSNTNEQGTSRSGYVEADGSWTFYLPPGTFEISYIRVGDEKSVKIPKPLVVEKGKNPDPVIVEMK